MDVLTAAWTGAGEPHLDTEDGRLERCDRCGRTAALTPVREVVSKVFTAFDSWVSPAGTNGVCSSCVWGYKNPDLRSAIHLVTPTHLVELDRHATTQLLYGPLAGVVALVVPLRPGRKHLLPVARWGRITTDAAALTWSTSDAERLRHVVELRDLGFGSRMLTEPSPPYPVLRQVSPELHAHVVDIWSALNTWRTTAQPWLDLALHLTK